MPINSPAPPLHARLLGLCDYLSVWQAMRDFTDQRGDETVDELWLVEHPPVFTLGQAGKRHHILHDSDIPVLQTDRGGQVTYHGPGQLVAYPLLNLKRRKLGVRELVSRIEASVVRLLASYSIDSAPRADAPGVYVGQQKIASLGLRVRKGCSFHGVAINIAADLAAFQQINPCGYAGLEMVNLASLTQRVDLPDMQELMHNYARCLAMELQCDCAILS